MNFGHWLERIKAKRKQRDKESVEKMTKSEEEFSRKGCGGPAPQAPALLVSSSGLLPTWWGWWSLNSQH
jgi:hypothetical protein